jgi:uncharacterized protein YkwD
VPTAVARLAAPILAAVVGLSVAGPAMAAGLPPFDVQTLDQAQIDLVTLVNQQRVAHGLIALQSDADATAFATRRAQAIASMGVLTHTGPDGQTVFDAIRASGMTWFAAGEILVWNNYPTEPDSTAHAVAAWLASPSHNAIMLSADYNYVGFGAAVSASGDRYYAGIFMKLPDRTAGWAAVGPVSVAALDATKSRVTVRWSGGDTQLQVLTAGLRVFEVQRRMAGGAWLSAGTTTRSSLQLTLARGHLYEFRIRARDNAGNRSAWTSAPVRT